MGGQADTCYIITKATFHSRYRFVIMPGYSVKDVDQHKFVIALANHLKKSGKLKVPDWVDLVKLARFKELDRSHLLSVSLGVERSLGQKYGMFLGSNSELVVECVMPDLLHVVPVSDDTVFDGILQREDTSLGLSFIPYIGILLSHTHHDTLVARTTHNGGEDSPRCIVSGEASLAHTGPIVNNQSRDFVRHVGEVCVCT